MSDDATRKYRSIRWSVILIALNLAPVFQYQSIACTYLLLWHAPLRVLSTKRGHQSPELTILSHISCFIQGEVTGFQVLLNSLHVVGGRPDGILQFSKREAVKIFLASVSSTDIICENTNIRREF